MGTLSFGIVLGPLGQHGPLVKWLRHRPFTAVTRVRVPYGSPIWRLSSAGRALASHARGHRFEFCSLHHSRANPCDLHGFSLLLSTFSSESFLRFFSDPNRDPYGNMERNGRDGKRGDRWSATVKFSVYLKSFCDIELTI